MPKERVKRAEAQKGRLRGFSRTGFEDQLAVAFQRPRARASHAMKEGGRPSPRTRRWVVEPCTGEHGTWLAPAASQLEWQGG